MDEFTRPQLTRTNLDKYIVRSSILRDLLQRKQMLKGILLDVGCGVTPYRDILLNSNDNRIHKYIGLDLETDRYGKTKPDLSWDGNTIPLEAQTVDSVLLTEVLEHCPEPERLLREIRRVLNQKGVVFFTIPFLWPLHEVPFDEFRYTPFAIQRLFKSAGFSRIELNSLGGWDASLAQMLGLWVRRRPMSNSKRSLLSSILLPIIRYLLSKDKRPTEFKESTMITGLSGLAYA